MVLKGFLYDSVVSVTSVAKKMINMKGIYLKKNLGELAKKDPDLARKLETTIPGQDIQIIFSRGGLPVIKIGHITFHSLVDPEKEARDWAKRIGIPQNGDDQKNIGVFGFGTGYHVKAFLNSWSSSVTILEPRLDVLRVAFEAADFSADLGRLIWVVDYETLLKTNISVLLRHQPSVRLHLDLFRIWEKEISQESRYRETAADLAEAFKDHEEVRSFFEDLPAQEVVQLEKFVDQFPRNPEGLKDWQIIFYLMREFKNKDGSTPRGAGHGFEGSR